MGDSAFEPPLVARSSLRGERSWPRRFVAHVLRSPSALIGLIVVLIWVVVAVFAPLIAPYDPNALVGPPLQAPGGEFLLGTDQLGRDLFSRLVYGARTILVLAPLAVLAAELLGAIFGLLSGYVGGIVDDVIMRVNDVLIAFPTIIIYLLIIAALGPSKLNVVLAIAVGSSPGIVRIVRGAVLTLREQNFMKAARVRGERTLYVLAVELFPNVRSIILVDAFLRIGFAGIAIGTLGFLGLGAPPPDPDWGGMISDGVSWLGVSPWLVMVPAFALTSLVVALNLFADGLRTMED